MNYKTCKEYAAEQKERLKELISKEERKPRLSIIQVGDNPASNAYVRGKLRDCEEVGIGSKLVKLEEDISQSDLDKAIMNENIDTELDGIIVQLPLPAHLDEKSFLKNIYPIKDVDGFRVDSKHTPCTPLGVMNYLLDNNIQISGKHCVVIGRSDIVGKPMAKLLLEHDATVTVCHSKTENLSFYTRSADIVIVAVGRRNMLNGNMVKDGAIVVDVGINRNEEGKLCGDCDYDSLVGKCKLVTPVPGGVGLITRVQLLQNTYASFLIRRK